MATIIERFVSILIITLFLLMPLILANDLEISLNPHFFKDGREIIPTPEIQYSAISLEIIGKNFNERHRILNLSIIDSYPKAFKDSLPRNIIIEMLRIKQQKTLWVSQIIDIEDLKEFNQTNISLWIGVGGIHEGTKKEIYSESHLNIILSNKTEEEPNMLFSIGDKIWEDNPGGGLLVMLIVIVTIGFYCWKHKGAEKLANWREKTEKKRIERREFEEGW